MARVASERRGMFLDLSSGVNPATIKEMLVETERVFREHGHGGVFDSWRDDLDRMKKSQDF